MSEDIITDGGYDNKFVSRKLTLYKMCSILKGMMDAKLIPTDMEFPIALITYPDHLVVSGGSGIVVIPLTEKGVGPLSDVYQERPTSSYVNLTETVGFNIGNRRRSESPT